VLVKKDGLLLSIVSPPDEALAKEHGITARFERGNMNGIRLQEIAGLIDAGKLKVIIDKEFPLAQAKAAHDYSETGRARGKIILRVRCDMVFPVAQAIILPGDACHYDFD
jgi:NADPH:quinone reductase-like Zn-dependent oxidoreductase